MVLIGNIFIVAFALNVIIYLRGELYEYIGCVERNIVYRWIE
jgi:hypothetical protein